MIGHVGVRRVVEPQTPDRPLLLIGPGSIGKRTLAHHLASVWGIPEELVVDFPQLTADLARSVASLAGFTGLHRLFILGMTGTSDATQNTLLKTIEESPTSDLFVLVSDHDLQETLMSRCWVHRMSVLTDDQVERILLARNFFPKRAAELAAHSGGQVSNALEEANDGGTTRLSVLAAVSAIQLRDEDALDTLSQRWSDAHTALLTTLCTEFLSGRFRRFSPEDVESPSKPLFLRILTALRADVRPRLVVRSSLMTVLRSFT